MAHRVGRMVMGLSATAVLLVLSDAGVQVKAASNTPVLVELFTSEGCSSCPPADQLLRELDARQDVSGAHVIALSEHVDYWDHLGWRDAFSSPVWTDRQQHYAGLLRDGEVYTPEAVIDGAHGVVGSDMQAVRSQISASAGERKQPLEINAVERQGKDIVVTVSGGPYAGSMLFAVLADEHDRTKVAAGENAGHALEHVAVARTLVPFPASSKDGQSSVRVTAPDQQRGPSRVVVFAQAKDGRIVAAAERPGPA